MRTFAYLEDYVKDFSDPKKNHEALEKAQATGLPVYITGDVKVAGKQIVTDKDLVITGFNKNTSKLTFLSKVGRKKGLFACDNSKRKEHTKGVRYSGLSIDFSNVTFTSAYYDEYAKDGVDAYFGKDYKFGNTQYIYNENEEDTVIDVRQVSVKNCRFEGDLSIAYQPKEAMRFLVLDGTNWKDGTKYGIQKVEFDNNEMHLTKDVLRVDAFPNEAYFRNNTLKNCIGVGIKTNFCKSVYVFSNEFENDFVMQPHMLNHRTHYTCLAQVIGGTLYGRNNKCKNILGIGPELEVYDFYVGGGGNIDWQNNESLNVAFNCTDIKQVNCLIKVKNAVNLTYKNNSDIIEKWAFDAIKMIEGLGYSAIVGSSGNKGDGTLCDISHNYFKVPYLSDISKVYNTNHNIVENTFVIGKIYNDTLFQDQQGMRGFNMVTDNSFKIGEVVGGVLNIFNRNNTTTKKTLFNDNEFSFGKSCTVTFGNEWGRNHVEYGINTNAYIAENNTVENGTLIHGVFPNFNSVGYPFTEKFHAGTKVINSYTNAETYIKTLEGVGVSSIEIRRNRSKEMGLILMRRKDFTYNGANEFFKKGIVIFNVDAEFDGKKLSYEFVIHDMNTMEFGSQKIRTINHKDGTIHKMHGKSKDGINIPLLHEPKYFETYIGFKDIGKYENIKVSVSMEFQIT